MCVNLVHSEQPLSFKAGLKLKVAVYSYNYNIIQELPADTMAQLITAAACYADFLSSNPF